MSVPATFLHSAIELEYKRWLKLVGDDPYSRDDCVGIHDVLQSHFLIADFFVESEYGIGGIGPKSVDLLHSALYRQFVSFGGKDKWANPLEKCATLLFGLVKDHPFHDANKRTALLVALYQLDKLKRTPTASQLDLENFVVEIADDRLAKYARYKEISAREEEAEILFIADYLKRNTRLVDKRQHVVTYHQLNRLLQRHGFRLTNTEGNYIDIVRMEDRPKYLGLLGPTVRKEVWLAQIGFPGWKRQIGKSALATVRKSTGLTPERGYDSAVFFSDAEPLDELIAIYAEPLRRLANR